MRMLGTAILVLVVVAALGARALPFDPVQLDLSQALDPPTWSHPLGDRSARARSAHAHRLRRSHVCARHRARCRVPGRPGGRQLRRALRVRGGTRRDLRGDAGGERGALVSGRVDGAAAGGPGGPGCDQSHRGDRPASRTRLHPSRPRARALRARSRVRGGGAGGGLSAGAHRHVAHRAQRAGADGRSVDLSGGRRRSAHLGAEFPRYRGAAAHAGVGGDPRRWPQLPEHRAPHHAGTRRGVARGVARFEPAG